MANSICHVLLQADEGMAHALKLGWILAELRIWGGRGRRAGVGHTTERKRLNVRRSTPGRAVSDGWGLVINSGLGSDD